MVGTGEPIGQSGIFGNDLGTMLDPNQPIYRLSKKIPWLILTAALSRRYAVQSWDLADNQALFSMTGANASPLMPSARHAKSVTAFRPSTFLTGSPPGIV